RRIARFSMRATYHVLHDRQTTRLCQSWVDTGVSDAGRRTQAFVLDGARSRTAHSLRMYRRPPTLYARLRRSTAPLRRSTIPIMSHRHLQLSLALHEVMGRARRIRSRTTENWSSARSGVPGVDVGLAASDEPFDRWMLGEAEIAHPISRLPA